MLVHLNFNGKLYTLNLLNVDIWTHEAAMNDEDMKDFIQAVLKDNPKLLQPVVIKEIK